MTPCIIESPYAGDVANNKAYLQRCIRWCMVHGWTPYASHQMLTDALNDNVPELRKSGMHAGLEMSLALAKIGAPWLFFVDNGISGGMLAAYREALLSGRHAYAVSLNGTHGLQTIRRDSLSIWVPAYGNYAEFVNLWTPDGSWADATREPDGWVAEARLALPDEVPTGQPAKSQASGTLDELLQISQSNALCAWLDTNVGEGRRSVAYRDLTEWHYNGCLLATYDPQRGYARAWSTTRGGTSWQTSGVFVAVENIHAQMTAMAKGETDGHC